MRQDKLDRLFPGERNQQEELLHAIRKRFRELLNKVAADQHLFKNEKGMDRVHRSIEKAQEDIVQMVTQGHPIEPDFDIDKDDAGIV